MERLYEITPEIKQHILSYLSKEKKETFTVIYGARLDITTDVLCDINSEQGKKCLTVNYGKLFYNKETNDFYIKTIMDKSLTFSKENNVLIIKCSVTAPEALMTFMQVTETLNAVKQDDFKVYVLVEIKAESEKITKSKNSIRIPIELPEGSDIWISGHRNVMDKGGYQKYQVEKIGTVKTKLSYHQWQLIEVYLDIMSTGGDYARRVDFLYSEKEVEYYKKTKEKKDELLKTIRDNTSNLNSLSVEELEKIAAILTNGEVN